MNELEKELIKRSEENVNKQEELVSDVKLLLENNAQEEIQTLRSIGLSADIEFAETRIEDLLIRDRGKELYDRHIVHVSELNKLCSDYRLYMRPARDYVGRIPADLGAELTRFCKEKSVALPASSSYSKFFIVAPPKMFRGYMNPWQVFLKAVDDSYRLAEERRRLASEDPILIYQLDNKDYYAVIKSWGSDFTWVRKTYGFFTKRKTVKFLNFATTGFILYLMYKFAAWQSMKFYTMDVGKESSWIILALIIDTAIAICGAIWLWSQPFIDMRKSIINTITGRNH